MDSAGLEKIVKTAVRIEVKVCAERGDVYRGQVIYMNHDCMER
jgi:hypothetical protein